MNLSNCSILPFIAAPGSVLAQMTQWAHCGCKTVDTLLQVKERKKDGLAAVQSSRTRHNQHCYQTIAAVFSGEPLGKHQRSKPRPFLHYSSSFLLSISYLNNSTLADCHIITKLVMMGSHRDYGRYLNYQHSSESVEVTVGSAFFFSLQFTGKKIIKVKSLIQYSHCCSFKTT